MVTARVAQGDIWLLETPNLKHRPVLVVSRDEVIPVIRDVVVAPITGTIRSIPTNIPVGMSEGIHKESVATFDALAAVPKAFLTIRLGSLPPERHHEICAALNALSDC